MRYAYENESFLLSLSSDQSIKEFNKRGADTMFKPTLGRYAIAALSLIVLSACANGEDANEDRGEVNFGVAAGPYGTMVEDYIGPLLEEEYGYTVTTTTFNDYVQPNLALDEGDTEANLFQHTDYFESFSEEHGLNLQSVSTVPTLGMGLYASEDSGYESLEDIEDGARILIPQDASNLARALTILADYDLIEYDDSIAPTQITVDDITENPLNLDFLPIDAAQIAHSLDSSAEIATIPGNFSFAAELDPNTALAIENMGDNFYNIAAVREDDDELAEHIFEVIRSDAFYEAIENSETFSGFNRPEWWPEE